MPICVKSLVGAKLMEVRELALGAISRLTKSEELPPKEDEFVFVEESDAEIPEVPQPAPEPVPIIDQLFPEPVPESEPAPVPVPESEPEPVLARVVTPLMTYCVEIQLPAGFVRNPVEPWKLENPEDIWHERILIGATRSGSKAKCSFFDTVLRSCVTVTGDVVTGVVV